MRRKLEQEKITYEKYNGINFFHQIREPQEYSWKMYYIGLYSSKSVTVKFDGVEVLDKHIYISCIQFFAH